MKIKQVYKLRNVLIVIFLILLINESCKNDFRKDLSLTTEQYLEQGMPACNKIWTADDYQQAQITLSTLITKDFHALPRKKSRKSGDVFKRIVSKDNLSFLDDPKISLREKAYRIQFLGNLSGQMGTIYYNKLDVRQYYSEELAEIYITHLYIRGKMLELAEKIDKSDLEEDKMMQSGKSGIHSSYILLINFILSEMEKTKAFSESDMKRLIKEIEESISDNFKYFDLRDKKEIYTLLTNSIKGSPSPNTGKSFKNTLILLAS
jgi:hypothetical protein